jgi:hypothetical protein
VAGASTTFSYTGAEQTYTVPSNADAVYVVATGGAGGGPAIGLTGGRGAIAAGFVGPVSPGDTLYVNVGGVGAKPTGGFGGGGDGGLLDFGPFGILSSWGGGGASDVRTASGDLLSRLIVAGAGGGSASPAARGGDAGAPGTSSPGSSVGGGAGTQIGGGTAGCPASNEGCGTPGTLGVGGHGGASGAGFTGGGGGGGLYGGGGGAGNQGGGSGGGGGGSSLVPVGGTSDLVALTEPPSVVIATHRIGLPPADPQCMADQITGLTHAFGGIAAAAHAFGVSVRQGIDFLLSGCSTGHH